MGRPLVLAIAMREKRGVNRIGHGSAEDRSPRARNLHRARMRDRSVRFRACHSRSFRQPVRSGAFAGDAHDVCAGQGCPAHVRARRQRLVPRSRSTPSMRRSTARTSIGGTRRRRRARLTDERSMNGPQDSDRSGFERPKSSAEWVAAHRSARSPRGAAVAGVASTAQPHNGDWEGNCRTARFVAARPKHQAPRTRTPDASSPDPLI